LRVRPKEDLPLDIQVTVQIAVAYGAEIGVRDVADFALGFAVQDPPRYTMRLALGTASRTVPGTVPTVVPEASILA
jgi:hypothetical protein